MIARTRDRSQDANNVREEINNRKDAKNIRGKINNRKTSEFEASTHREPSNFEKVKAEMIVLHDENVASKIQNVLHRADSTLERERRGRERDRGREHALTKNNK